MTKNGGYELVDPTTQPLVASFSFAPRLLDIRGKRIGLIDDSKTNAKELLEDLASILEGPVRDFSGDVPSQAFCFQARGPAGCGADGEGVRRGNCRGG